MTYDEIKQVRLAKNITIPLLEEVLEKLGNKTLLNIEIKAVDAAAEVGVLIQEFNLDLIPEKLIISSFMPKSLKIIKKIDKKIITGLLYNIPRGKIKIAQQIKCDALHPYFGDGCRHKLQYPN